jgi:hypothetical protein
LFKKNDIAWVSPANYDIYPEEDNVLEEVNLFFDAIKIVEE